MAAAGQPSGYHLGDTVSVRIHTRIWPHCKTQFNDALDNSAHVPVKVPFFIDRRGT